MTDPVRVLREALDSPTVHASRRDPIRARLDRIELGCSVFGEPQEMVDALRAVLDLHTPHPRAMDGYCHTCGQRPCAIRRVIAENLGVTDG